MSKPIEELKDESKELQRQQNLNANYEEFAVKCMPFGSRDVMAAIEAYDKVGLNGHDLFEDCEQFVDETGINFSDLDVCFIAYDRILEEARNEIDNILNIDICNDYDVYTIGNYMCTSFGCSDLEALREAIKEATQEQKEQLKDNDFVMFVFDELSVGVEK